MEFVNSSRDKNERSFQYHISVALGIRKDQARVIRNWRYKRFIRHLKMLDLMVED